MKMRSNGAGWRVLLLCCGWGFTQAAAAAEQRAVLPGSWAEWGEPQAALPVLLPTGKLLLFLTDVERPYPGVVSVRGHAPGGETLFLFRSPATTTGILQDGAAQYRLQQTDGVWTWIDARLLPPPHRPAADDIAPHVDSDQTRPVSKAVARAGETAIDLIVLYTPGYAGDHGGAIGVRAKAAEAIAYTHAAFAESGLAPAYRVVYMQEYAVNESDQSFSDNLAQIESDPAVAQLRDSYGADLVSLLRRVPVSTGTLGGVCGLAHLYRGPAANSDRLAYSVVATGSPCGVRTFAHELGHNMGAAHERGGLGSAGGANQPWKPYAYAWRCGGFTSVMHYQSLSGDREGLFFSNPALSKNGESCGSTAPLNEADNARAHRDALPLVAQHRPTMPAPSTFSFEQSEVAVSASASSVSLGIVRSGDPAGAASVEVFTVSNPDGPTPAQAGTDYTERLERLNFADGQTRAEFTIVLKPRPDPSPRVFHAVLDFPLRARLGSASSRITVGPPPAAGANPNPNPNPSPNPLPSTTPSGDSGGGAFGALGLLALSVLLRRAKRKPRATRGGPGQCVFPA
jgi:uncharacterized protein (TIGR03382 family)